MNNIYVDELPKNCGECPYRYEQCGILNYCNVFDDGLAFISDQTLKKGRLKSCPLKLLSTRLAEERKKVVQEIREKISDGLYQNSYGETFIDGDIYEILDQIERNIDG